MSARRWANGAYGGVERLPHALMRIGDTCGTGVVRRHQLISPDSPTKNTNVDLWCVRPQDTADQTDLQRCRDLLTPEERQAADQFYVPDIRRDRLISKALMRTVLSSYIDVPPTEWRFRSGLHGKPEIDTPAIGRRLHFSLSRTKGLIACLVAMDHEVGVDVEYVDRTCDVIDIAARYFTPAESSSLLELTHQDRIHRFFELWTLKEAYVKARGLGLFLPLDAAAFEFHGVATHPTTRFGSAASDDASRWQFTVDWVDRRHVLATVTACGSEVRVMCLPPVLTRWPTYRPGPR